MHCSGHLMREDCDASPAWQWLGSLMIHQLHRRRHSDCRAGGLLMDVTALFHAYLLLSDCILLRLSLSFRYCVHSEHVPEDLAASVCCGTGWLTDPPSAGRLETGELRDTALFGRPKRLACLIRAIVRFWGAAQRCIRCSKRVRLDLRKGYSRPIERENHSKAGKSRGGDRRARARVSTPD